MRDKQNSSKSKCCNAMLVVAWHSQALLKGCRCSSACVLKTACTALEAWRKRKCRSSHMYCSSNMAAVDYAGDSSSRGLAQLRLHGHGGTEMATADDAWPQPEGGGIRGWTSHSAVHQSSAGRGPFDHGDLDILSAGHGTMQRFLAILQPAVATLPPEARDKINRKVRRWCIMCGVLPCASGNFMRNSFAGAVGAPSWNVFQGQSKFSEQHLGCSIPPCDSHATTQFETPPHF